MKVELVKTVFLLPKTEKQIIYYAPWLHAGLSCNHRIGRRVQCYLDTGSAINVFPLEYAQVFLGFSETSIKRGMYMPITGAGNSKNEAWGYKCTLDLGDIVLKDTLVFFLANQPYPLLGQAGFIDRFKRIEINMKDKFIEFEQ